MSQRKSTSRPFRISPENTIAKIFRRKTEIFFFPPIRQWAELNN